MCIRARLKMTAKKYGQTIVMITHDDEIAQVADLSLIHILTVGTACVSRFKG